MLGRVDYLVWMVGFLLEIYVLVCSISRRDFLRYLPVNIYMGSAALVALGEYFTIQHYGFQSMNYRYYYYYSESLLTILLFWVIILFYQQVFAERSEERRVGKECRL